MNPQTQMLAVIISKSLNLGDEWTVVDVEMRERDPDPGELHVYIERTPGHSLRRPRCGALQAVYDCERRDEAESELDSLCSWIMRSNIPQMKTVAKTIRENKAEVLNYFDHRRTNAVLEGMNSIVQSAKGQARGFSNLEYFKTIIYLNLGKPHFPQLEACATH